MKASWPTSRLGDHVRFLSGGTPKKSRPEYWEGDIPWVGSGEMVSRFISDTSHRLTVDGAENGTRRVPEGTVLVVVRGMSLAKEFRVALTRRDVTFNQDLKAVMPSEDLRSRFLFYYLLSQRARIRQSSTEASHGTKKLELQVLENWPVPIPGTDEQDRIVDVIGAYDDLIENNRRRIQLLEESARLLYREWFVHLRFPGHEHVRIVDGIPEGWSKTAIGDACQWYRGRSYRSHELVDDGEGVPFVNLKCVGRNGGFRKSGVKRFSGDCKASQYIFPGDTVVAVTDMTRDRLVIGEAARVSATVSPEAVFSMDLVKLVPIEDVEPEWFYFMLRYSRVSLEIKERASGTNVLHLNPKHIAQQGIVLPVKSLRREFSEIARPILQQIDSLEAQNDKLSKARDLLLPRIMSGEIAV